MIKLEIPQLTVAELLQKSPPGLLPLWVARKRGIIYDMKHISFVVQQLNGKPAVRDQFSNGGGLISHILEDLRFIDFVCSIQHYLWGVNECAHVFSAHRLLTLFRDLFQRHGILV